MNKLLFFILPVAFVLLSSCIYRNQLDLPTPGLGGSCSIYGTIWDDDNKPIPGFTVHLSGATLSGVRTTTTDIFGNYFFYQLPPGNDYTIVATAPGFYDLEHPRVILYPFTSLRLNFMHCWEPGYPILGKMPVVDYKSTDYHSVFTHNPITGELTPP